MRRVHRTIVAGWRASADRPAPPELLGWFRHRRAPSAYVVHWRPANPRPDWVRLQDQLEGLLEEAHLKLSRPRFGCASARSSDPDIGPAPSQLRHSAFRYRFRVCHTGLQYRAVDSMTTSWTFCSISHSVKSRSWSGLPPNCRRSKSHSPSTATSATTTASIFL